jgi:hypothetical protein
MQFLCSVQCIVLLDLLGNKWKLKLIGIYLCRTLISVSLTEEFFETSTVEE